jgi:hypothetical protein
MRSCFFLWHPWVNPSMSPDQNWWCLCKFWGMVIKPTIVYTSQKFLLSDGWPLPIEWGYIMAHILFNIRMVEPDGLWPQAHQITIWQYVSKWGILPQYVAVFLCGTWWWTNTNQVTNKTLHLFFGGSIVMQPRDMVYIYTYNSLIRCMDNIRKTPILSGWVGSRKAFWENPLFFTFHVLYTG